jgi:hypothetical protein
LFLICFVSFSSNSQNIRKKKDIITGEYLAVVKTDADTDSIKKKFDSYGIKEFKLVTKTVLKITLKKDPGFEEVKKLASSLKQIESIEPNRIIRLDDPKMDSSTIIK